MRTALAASLAALALLAGCGDAEEDPDATPSGSSTSAPTPAPSAVESSSAAPTPAPTSTLPPVDSTKLTLAGMPDGDRPAIAFLEAYPDGGDRRSLVRPDGSTLQLPVPGIFDFVTTADGGAVTLVAEGNGTSVVVVDAAGAEVRRERSRGYRLAVSADGELVAWLRRDRRTTVLSRVDGTTRQLPESPEAGEIGAVGPGTSCPDVVEDGYGCEAWLNGEETTEAHFVDSHGQSAPLGGPIVRVSDIDLDSRLLGLISVDDLGSCSGIMGDHPGRLTETCDYTLTRFSPDSTRVLGTDAYLDGFGQRTVAFLDAAGLAAQHVFTSSGRGATVLQTAWEDDDHVLAVVYQRGRWAVVRLGVDGTAEVAVGPVAGSDLDRQYFLEQD